jgi:uncharacterized protein (TIGR03435 family)
MESTIFNIEAKVSAGATPEQFRLMEQNLLAERFKLAVHFVREDVVAYEMTVSQARPQVQRGVKLPETGPSERPISRHFFWKGRVHVETPRFMDQLVRSCGFYGVAGV